MKPALKPSLILPLALAVALGAAWASPAEAARGFDVRDLHALDRVSSPVLSPDGAFVVFAKREMSGAKGDDPGKASTSLWIRDLRTRDLAPAKRLTPVGWNVNSPAFSADGKWLYFLSAQSGTQQVYVMPATGGTPSQATHYPLDVGSFKVSPDGRRLAISMEVFPDCGADIDCTVKRLEERKASRATGVVYDQLFVRHWDTWEDGRHNRLFVTSPGTGKSRPTTFLVDSSTQSSGVGNVPSKPFGGNDEYTWSPDGESIVFAMRRADRQEAWSTDFDLYRYRAGQPLEHLTLDDRTGANAPSPGPTGQNRAWDTGPVFSADGSKLYYRAMKRPGFEADRFALMERDVATGATREIAPDWDRSADGIVLSADGRTIYTTAQDMGEHPLFAVDIASGKVEKVVGGGSISSFDIAGDTLVFTRNSLQSGDQVFVTSLSNPQAERAITPSASQVLPDVAFGDYEQFSFPGWNGETVHGYVVKPWNYEEGKRYPVAFLIHGGPQGSFGNGWSYRWNPQTYAGQGYAVVMIDFHGSTGYGQAFTDSISGDWGGKPLEDLQKGWAAAQQKYPFLDGDKACALGASYGGYMINWIAGNWFDEAGRSPWKCLVNHDGVFDTRAMGYVTEELWFTEWENQGTPFDKPENFEKFNPVNHVAKWRVPMLVVQGEKDYRVPVDQGLSTFTALQRKGIESKLLYFPDENHWVLKPANSVLWHDTVNDWLKKHIGQ
ncbi:alpha/beta hydrolase family protein [Pseudoxanthomonas suwonensis]|uniref:S9 family peptidase n=1 Tax=Pseudoxanthomonas suwonensis TaxID=314722 RepID=UPI0004B7B19A|nr:S9 family peptidase [Pseudoxanthomonas suwonensis]